MENPMPRWHLAPLFVFLGMSGASADAADVCRPPKIVPRSLTECLAVPWDRLSQMDAAQCRLRCAALLPLNGPGGLPEIQIGDGKNGEPPLHKIDPTATISGAGRQ
jgi:hypothetical protein